MIPSEPLTELGLSSQRDLWRIVPLPQRATSYLALYHGIFFAGVVLMVLPYLVSSVFGVCHGKEFLNLSLALPVLLASLYYRNLVSHSRDNTRMLVIHVFMKHLAAAP
jgi:hypothetical protein